MADFIPSENAKLVTWLTNLIAKVEAFGGVLGMTELQITTFEGVLQGILNEVQAVPTARNAWQATVATLRATKQTKLGKTGPVRSQIGKWKASGLLTPAMEQEMKLVGTEDGVDPNTYRPGISAEARSGFVRVTFKKLGVDGVNVYMRLKGQSVWRKLAFDSISPYDDHTELAVTGVPEVREYRALGVIDDEEIGQPSDIVSVTFAG
ncbi:MAG: hypothetical protein AABP62_05805 [Planctomycetota bacterium]